MNFVLIYRSTNICKHEDQTEDKERQDWYKNQNFYHNFWYYEFQHCQFLEAVGLVCIKFYEKILREHNYYFN